MDLGTILGLTSLAICIFVILLLISYSKKKKKQFFQKLFDLAGKSNCKISESDHWNETLIGIDKEVNKLFFIRKTGDKDVNLEIDLADIQKCRLVNSSRMVTSKESTNNVIDKLELVLTRRDLKAEDTVLEFYNTNRDNLFLNGELALSEKWAAVINKSIEANTSAR